jgi:hypothetical protein
MAKRKWEELCCHTHYFPIIFCHLVMLRLTLCPIGFKVFQVSLIF